VNDTWLDDYFQQWLYDQDLIDRANDLMNIESTQGEAQ
jgi:hypothetical protein